MATGILGWTPDTFWTSTYIEYASAIRGFNRAHGAPDEKSELSQDWLDDLKARTGGGNGDRS